jgi:Secretion system C-terminal sorting domain/SprB repeat
MNRILLQKPIRSFMKGKIWTKTMALLLLFLVLCFNNAKAQIAFNVTGNTNTTPNLATSYTSLANATTAINSITAITGNVSFVASSGVATETAPPKGFTIGSTTLNAAMIGNAFTITINGSQSTINAGIGTSTIALNPDGMVKLVGADKIIFTQFKLKDNNTSGAAMMEFGIGLFKASATDGCNSNEISFNDFAMQRANTYASSGAMTGGATGIIMVNAIHATSTTFVTPTSVAGANSFNTIYNNVIDGGINGIFLSGYNDPISPYTLADYSNQVNSNGIYNFGFDVGATALNACGIFSVSQFEVKIETNFLDNNNGAGVNQIYNLYGINVAGTNAANPLINNNIIELTSGSPNFILNGIQNSSGLSSTVNITNNIIRFGYPNGTTPAAVAVRGISNASLPTTLNINNNTIEGIGGSLIAGTGETNFIINNTTALTPNVNTNNNIIRNFERTGSAGDMYSIRIFATNWTANANVINNLKFSAVGSTGNIYGLTAVANTVNSSLTNNIISNLSIPFSGSINGIYEIGAAGIKTINSNQIFNFATSTGGSGGSTFSGIYCASGTTTISNNSIYSLNISGTDATVASSVNAIRLFSPTNTLANNKIYDLSANSVFGSVYGIYNGSGAATLYNNVISDVRAPNTSSSNGVNGILTNGSLNLYYNTILLNETVKNGANTGSNAVFFNSSNTLISRNNIFINKSVVNGSGQATALFCSSFATTYDTSSNNNLLNASTIFTDGINSDTTLAAFKTRMATRDQASVTETTTPFISTVGSNAGFLRLPTNANSVANNNALPITSPAITTDYFGVSRSATTPDIGASEFAGFVCTTPTFTSNPPNRSICAGSNTTFSVAATSATTYQWQLNNGSGFADITNGGVYSGATTSTLTITGATPAMSGYLYRAVAINVLNTCFTNSNSGTLFVSNITSVIGSITNVSCFGGSNGAATVIAGGGIGGYTYSWSPTGGTAATATGLAAGSYTVTITDGIGCTATRTFTVTQPPAIVLTPASQTNISCNGGSNGTVAVNAASGGSGGFIYDWTPGTPTGDGTTSVTGLTAGTWTCTATDANGCARSQSFTVTQPPALSTVASFQTNIACNGASTGAAGVNPSGGFSPYTYSWTNGATTNAISGLIAGSYTVTVTDANGCTATRSFTITQPAALSGTTIVTNVSCNGGSNGAINLTPTGGTAPYTFNWGGGVTTEDRTGLIAGTYSVTITDANGCVRTVNNIFITQPASVVSGSTSQTNVACFGGSTGAINLTPTGGTAPYTFNWGGGITTEDRTGLAAGTYSVTITDANGCTATNTNIISQPSAITATTSQTNVSCRTGSNGTATIVASGGAGSYTYFWSPSGGTAATATGLVAGTYTCTATDANGCTLSRVYSITQPTAIAATITRTDVSCNSGANGSASIAVSGGTGGYSYNWTPGNPTGNGTTSVSGLVAGTYTCTVTDANGCTAARPFTITQPAAIDNSVSQALGIVSATQNGATYQWFQCPTNLISGETNQNFTPTAAGDYKVDITIAGCTVTSSCITVSTLGNSSFAFNSKLTVYPNPSSDVFFINSDSSGSFVVYDLIGKIIKTETIDLGITKLDLGNYPTGVYLMKVTNENNETKTLKLVKQ